MKINPVTALLFLCLAAHCTAASAQKTVKLEDLRRLVESKTYPALGASTTKSEALNFAACVAKIDTIVKLGAAKHVSRTIVSTNMMRVDKLWTAESATTLTCLGSDKKFLTTTAPYL